MAIIITTNTINIKYDFIIEIVIIIFTTWKSYFNFKTFIKNYQYYFQKNYDFKFTIVNYKILANDLALLAIIIFIIIIKIKVILIK